MATVEKVYVGLHIPRPDVDTIARDIKALILNSGEHAISKETCDILFTIHQAIVNK